ncbi:unnamed protein product [Dicrocoelium dendriticum]|nr:unnamed protein product [Dicrocoelium dendriticum]
MPGLWAATTSQTISKVHPEPTEEPQYIQGYQQYSITSGHQQIRAMVPQAPTASHSRGPRTATNLARSLAERR